MTKEELKLLSIQLQDDEIEVWKSILDKLNGRRNRV